MEQFRFMPTNQTSAKPSNGSDPNWVLGRVGLLMASYRKADYHDPEGFIATLGAILAQYEPEIVEYVTDPTTGIQRRCKWPPSPAEIVEACAAEIAHRAKVEKYSSMPPPLRLPKPSYSVTESYESMVKKHGRPIGVFESGRTIPYRG